MARVEIEMPQMGESVMEGTVIEWTKSVGDMVEEDETLLEIATDKVDTEVPSPKAGKLVEIKAEADETIEVGQVIAILETDSDEANTGETSQDDEEQQESSGEAEESGSDEEEKAAAGEPEEEQDEPKSEDEEQSSDEGERVEVKMPKMGESVMEGTVIGWSKSVGDEVEEDETLLEISTDKVDSEVPSPQAGTLVEILVEEGETVEVDQVICIIGTGEAAASSTETEEKEEAKPEKGDGRPEDEDTEEKSEEVTEEKTSTDKEETEGSEPQRIGSDGRFYSPLVRSIAKEEGISQEELESIEGSGQGGRVAKQDILSYLDDREAKQEAKEKEKAEEKKETGLSKPETKEEKRAAGKRSISSDKLDLERPSDNVEIVKMDRMRKMIAEHMINSKRTSAHVTTFAEVDVSKLVKWREKNKEKFKERSGYKLTYTPLFIEHILQAMREFPLVNSSLDLEKGEIHLKKDINFGLAVALGESGEGGLIVPVIKKAQEKNLVGLVSEVNELAQKARSRNLNPDDLVGGTITLTNYGSVGNLMGTPIINQPQVAIIGTGTIEKRPVVVEADGEDVIAIRHMMYLSMSYDHRVIDGAHGGAFLNRIKELLENFDPDRTV